MISTNLTINGPGADLLTVARSSSTGPFRIFQVNPNATGELSGMTIRGGVAPFGGGILNDGDLTLTEVAVVGNIAAGADGAVPTLSDPNGNTGD